MYNTLPYTPNKTRVILIIYFMWFLFFLFLFSTSPLPSHATLLDNQPWHIIFVGRIYLQTNLMSKNMSSACWVFIRVNYWQHWLLTNMGIYPLLIVLWEYVLLDLPHSLTVLAKTVNNSLYCLPFCFLSTNIVLYKDVRSNHKRSTLESV